MPVELESIDSELYQISKNEHLLECCSCKDLIKSEIEDYEIVADSIWCIQCLNDADLLAYRYG